MADALLGIRESVRVAQRKQADRMETRSKKFMPEVEIGDFVILPVPDVDRGPSDPPNLACRIVDINYETRMHELACQAGVLKDMYTRNAFDKLDGSLEGIRVDEDVSSRGCNSSFSWWWAGDAQMQLHFCLCQ